jgi:WD40 repeat protein
MSSRRAASVSTSAALLLAILCLAGALFVFARGRDRLVQGAAELRAHNEELVVELTETRARERASAIELNAERARAVRVEGELEVSRRALFLAQTEAAVQAANSGRWVEFDRKLAGVPAEHRDWLWRHLRLWRARAVRPLDLVSEVVAVALAPDGERLAAGTAGGEVYLLSTRPAGLLGTSAGFEEEVSALALAPDGEQIAVGTFSGLVGIFAPGEEDARDWFAADEGPTGLAFAPDGSFLAASFSDGAVCVWYFGRDDEPRWLDGHTFPANAVAVSPDGARVATAADDETVRVYEGPAYGEVRVLEGHDDWVRAVAFDERGRLISGGEDGQVLVWDAASGESLDEMHVGGEVIALSPSPDGALACVTAAGEVHTFGRRRAQRSELPLPTAEAMTVAPAVAPNGVVAFVGSGGALFLGDAAARARSVLQPEGGAVRAIAASDDGDAVAAACADGTLCVLDVETGEVRSRVRSAGGIVRALGLSPDGTRAAAGSRVAMVWDTVSGEVLHTWDEDTRFAALSFSADGRQLLAVGSDGSGHLFDLESGDALHRSPGPPGLVFAVAAGPRARRFGWIGDGGTVRVWEAASGTRAAALRVRELGRVDYLALSTDGARLGAVVNGAGISVLDTAAEQPHVRSSGPELTYFSIALSPSGERFATGSYEGEVALFDTATGTFLATFDAGDGGLASLEFSRDGSALVAGSSSGAVFVWGTR